MTLDERQLAVAIVLSLTLALRLLVMVQVRGWEHGDGIQREGTFQGVFLRLTFLLVGLGGALVWTVAPGWLPAPLPVPGWAALAALVSAECGLILLFWVHLSLGLHFSGTLRLREDHQLVQTGPYRWVRHPMYTSFLLLLGGLAVLIGDAVVSTTILSSQVWVLGVRLRHEEAMLAERFGAQWDTFQAQTGMLLPRWR